MIKRALFLLPLLLAGCASNGYTNTQVLTQQNYVVRAAPDALKRLPPLPPKLPNPKTATSAQVAIWLNNTEYYIASLEAQITSLISFYERPVISTIETPPSSR